MDSIRAAPIEPLVFYTPKRAQTMQRECAKPRETETRGQELVYSRSPASGAVWAAIHARQRAQFADDPGVRLPRSRDPAAPVADGRFAGTPSTVRAASKADSTAL